MGKSYYLSSEDGDDANDGMSQGTPWRTLAKVNGVVFAPGDAILFRRGGRWQGPLAPTGSGAVDAPITLGAYGEGPRPLVDGMGIGPAVRLQAVSGWVVEGFRLTSIGQSGLLIDPMTAKCVHFRVRDCEAYGCETGFSIGRYKTGGPGCLNDVVVEDCVSYDNKRNGFEVNGNYGNRSMPRNTRMVFRRLHTYHNDWDGIVMFATSGGVIEHCTAHDCGLKADGRYGIWTWNSDHVVIQYCEAYNCKTTGPCDGGGFDLDWKCDDCVIQYCYSHDNEGPFLLLIGDAGQDGVLRRPIARYNVSVNDMGKGALEYGVLSIYGAVEGARIYNNTIYHGRPSPVNAAVKTWTKGNNGRPSGITIRNNLIVCANGARALWQDPCWTDDPANTSDYNCYHALLGRALFHRRGVDYDKLDDFRAAGGQEPHSIWADPRLAAPGASPVGRLPLDGYQLLPDSPCLGAGVDLGEIGENDYWGNPLTAGSHNIGAFERR